MVIHSGRKSAPKAELWAIPGEVIRAQPLTSVFSEFGDA